MQTPPTTGEMAGVVKGGCHETRMVQRGPLDRASERRLRSCARGQRIREGHPLIPSDETEIARPVFGEDNDNV